MGGKIDIADSLYITQKHRSYFLAYLLVILSVQNRRNRRALMRWFEMGLGLCVRGDLRVCMRVYRLFRTMGRCVDAYASSWHMLP